MMGVLLEYGVAGERAEALCVERVERYADDPALRDEAGVHQVKKAGQELLVSQIAGRAEQDDDLGQLGTNARQVLSPLLSPPFALCIPRSIAPHPRVSGRQKRDSQDDGAPDFTAAI